MRTKRTRRFLALLFGAVGTVAGIHAQSASYVIVPCGGPGSIPYSGSLAFNVPVGTNPVPIADAILGDRIKDDWKCGVCGTSPELWSCNKENLGQGALEDFTVTGSYVTGGVWYIVGTYSGSVSVSCGPC